MKEPLPEYSHERNLNLHPHVVILGAGASRAAFPNGDKNGKKLPLLNELVEVVGLEPELLSLNIKLPITDFEAVFDSLSRTKQDTLAFGLIKNKIFHYFDSLEIPDELTLYDKLVLSLRPNDLIATFNWDPLLGLAFQRNRHLKQLPRLAFLHGNVFLGICDVDKTKGFTNCECSKCGTRFKPTNLLYPVLEKEYDSDDQINDEWNELRHRLQVAFMITIFGYSAPKTDVAARQILFEFWMKNRIKNFGQIEIIDIKNEDEIEDTWGDLLISHHYDISRSFDRSYLNDFPRRSCEAFASAVLYNDPWSPFIPYKGTSLTEYQKIIKDLISGEMSDNENNAMLSRW